MFWLHIHLPAKLVLSLKQSTKGFERIIPEILRRSSYFGTYLVHKTTFNPVFLDTYTPKKYKCVTTIFFPFQISCPASDCTISIPIILMEKYLGSQYDYEENAIDKKCPGCSKLVTFVPDSKSLNSRDGKSSLKISHSVDCGNGHYFCWECGKLQGHAPVSCGLWSKWQEKCTAMDSSGFFAWLNR